MESSFNVVEVVNRIYYMFKVCDKFGTRHINLLKKFEDRDDDLMVLGIFIIEAELSSEIAIVDYEG